MQTIKAGLIKAEELCVELNKKFNLDLTVNTIDSLRKKEIIPAVDTRTPGTKIPRWKYDLEAVKKVIEKL